MTIEKIEKAYNEILEVTKKYKDICIFNVNEMEAKAKFHLFGLKLKETYGFTIEPKDIRSLDWNNFGDYRAVGLFGEKYKRTISWEDDGKQPDDEILLCLSFPTGAYIFGDDYPVNFFKDFFQELKTYNPKYIDTTNKNLYFSMDNAGIIFNEFPTILKRYYYKNKEDAKARKIKKMEEELTKLKA